MCAMFSARVCGASARVSINSAAASPGKAASSPGMPGLSSTERNAARSMISTASTGSDFRRATASQAVATSGKNTSALALCGCSGTVR